MNKEDIKLYKNIIGFIVETSIRTGEPVSAKTIKSMYAISETGTEYLETHTLVQKAIRQHASPMGICIGLGAEGYFRIMTADAYSTYITSLNRKIQSITEQKDIATGAWLNQRLNRRG